MALKNLFDLYCLEQNLEQIFTLAIYFWRILKENRSLYKNIRPIKSFRVRLKIVKKWAETEFRAVLKIIQVSLV